jgi:hypothetical protein
MYAFRPGKAVKYRQQAEMIRILAEQVSLLEAKFHLFRGGPAPRRTGGRRGSPIGRDNPITSSVEP